MFARWDTLFVRGYDKNHRITYGSGRVVPVKDLEEACKETLARPEIEYIHIRTSQYNCYQCRLESAF